MRAQCLTQVGGTDTHFLSHTAEVSFQTERCWPQPAVGLLFWVVSICMIWLFPVTQTVSKTNTSHCHHHLQGHTLPSKYCFTVLTSLTLFPKTPWIEIYSSKYPRFFFKILRHIFLNFLGQVRWLLTLQCPQCSHNTYILLTGW